MLCRFLTFEPHSHKLMMNDELPAPSHTINELYALFVLSLINLGFIFYHVWISLYTSWPTSCHIIRYVITPKGITFSQVLFFLWNNWSFVEKDQSFVASKSHLVCIPAEECFTGLAGDCVEVVAQRLVPTNQACLVLLLEGHGCPCWGIGTLLVTFLQLEKKHHDRVLWVHYSTYMQINLITLISYSKG